MLGFGRAILGTGLGRAGLAGLALLLFSVVFGPVIWGSAAERIDTGAILQGPGNGHVFGTDGIGRDILARTIVATRWSVLNAALATALAGVLGVALGALPTVLSRRPAGLVTATIDLLVAFPGLLLAIFFATIFGVGASSAVLALGMAGAPVVARLTHTLASSVAGSDYVAAARILGVPRARLLLRHVLPNIAEPLLLTITISTGGTLLALSGLSFLGLGVQPPSYDWGRLLNEGLSRIYISPVQALAPGAAIVIAGLTFSLVGESLAQAVRRDTAAAGRWRFSPARSTEDGALESDADDGALLRVRGLFVSFPTPDGDVHVIRGVDLQIQDDELVGIVGESGAGKTVMALAIAQLLADDGRVAAETFRFDSHDLLAMTPPERQRVLGTTMPIVFQNPGTTLNPALRIGRQLTEVAEIHAGLDRDEAERLAIAKLRDVAIAGPERRIRAYPHALSGGMKQRAVIAMCLMGSPRLLIADEPTTALDVTVQRQIFDLLRRVKQTTRASVLFISHDISAVSELCSRLLVMYAGRIVEQVAVGRILHGAPAHPYTRALVAAVPNMDTDRDRPLATIAGMPPDPRRPTTGCSFAPRCPYADTRCHDEAPPVVRLDADWLVECWHPQGVDDDHARLGEDRV